MFRALLGILIKILIGLFLLFVYFSVCVYGCVCMRAHACAHMQGVWITIFCSLRFINLRQCRSLILDSTGLSRLAGHQTLGTLLSLPPHLWGSMCTGARDYNQVLIILHSSTHFTTDSFPQLPIYSSQGSCLSLRFPRTSILVNRKVLCLSHLLSLVTVDWPGKRHLTLTQPVANYLALVSAMLLGLYFNMLDRFTFALRVVNRETQNKSGIASS